MCAGKKSRARASHFKLAPTTVIADEAMTTAEGIPRMEDEVDPVVEEIDAVLVFPRGKLLVLDYPVPSAANKYFNPKSAKVRPRHNMVEIVYDTSDWMESQFFDKKFIPGIDREAYGESKFTSTKIDMRSQFACGHIENGKMYIMPVSQRLSMRPDFSHIDEANTNATTSDSTRNSLATSRDDDANVASDSRMNNGALARPNTSSAGGSSAVRVQIKKIQNSHSLAARERAYSTLMQNKESEKWVELDVDNSNTSHSEPQSLASISRASNEAGTVVADGSGNSSSGSLAFSVSPSEYLSSIAPAPRVSMTDHEDMRNVKAYIPPSSKLKLERREKRRQNGAASLVSV